MPLKVDGRTCTMRVETIHVKGGEDVLDTVWSSHHGPMVYLDLDSAHQSWNDLAMHWSAAEGGGELRTFYQLNKAGNAEDYRKALEWFACPAQNIVFASDQDDIAITVTGKLPLKYQGRTQHTDGSKASDDWKGFIGFADNPWILNPDRGFVVWPTSILPIPCILIIIPALILNTSATTASMNC